MRVPHIKPIAVRLTVTVVTSEEVVPSTSPDDLLHPVLIRGCDPVPEDKHEDKFEVVTNVTEH